ncbi:hypothetical protein ACWEOW_05150 [Monashia sp. NPDC004114]
MRIDDLSTTTKVTGFAVGLAAVFAVALGVGSLVGSDTPMTAATAGHDQSGADAHGHGSPSMGSPNEPASELPGGLAVAQEGYALKLATPTAAAGAGVPVSFTIAGPDGKPVTAFDIAHEKQLHLIAVRRDQSGFQHVHPTLAADGTWSTRLDLRPGTWRLFADFTATGASPLTLGADLSVAGDFQPVPTPAASRTAYVEGYAVTLAGDLVAGADARLTLSVTKDGKPVTHLDPYLGAYGHLVALRDGDLAYLHVHPDGEPGDGQTRPGPDVVFHTTAPSAGIYRLHLDFQHEGVVRTASFVVRASGTAPQGSPAPMTPSDSHGGGH